MKRDELYFSVTKGLPWAEIIPSSCERQFPSAGNNWATAQTCGYCSEKHSSSLCAVFATWYESWCPEAVLIYNRKSRKLGSLGSGKTNCVRFLWSHCYARTLTIFLSSYIYLLCQDPPRPCWHSSGTDLRLESIRGFLWNCLTVQVEALSESHKKKKHVLEIKVILTNWHRGRKNVKNRRE